MWLECWWDFETEKKRGVRKELPVDEDVLSYKLIGFILFVLADT